MVTGLLRDESGGLQAASDPRGRGQARVFQVPH
jgi:hypothetical protein